MSMKKNEIKIKVCLRPKSCICFYNMHFNKSSKEVVYKQINPSYQQFKDFVQAIGPQPVQVQHPIMLAAMHFTAVPHRAGLLFR